MSLKLNRMVSVLGVLTGSLVPFMAVYAVPVQPNASNTQYNAQASAPKSTTPTPSLDQSAAQPVAKANIPGKNYKDKASTPTFDWNGPYLGGYLGGAWGNSSLNTNAGVVTPTSYFSPTVDIRSVNQNGTGTIHPKSIIGGIQFGNNVQTGNVVYGAVLDMGSFALTGSKSATNVTYPSFPAQYRVKTAMSTSWLASLRARLGYVPSASWPLFYLTGGLAITNIHVFNSFSDNASSLGVGGSTNTKVKPGWVVGGGVEMPIRSNWTIDGEYQFVNFGSNSANGFVTCRPGVCSGFRSPFSTAANLSASMVRLGLNYKFS